MSNIIPIHQIKIGERRRQDYGNIQELADSIDKYGLLHPIVLDADNNLVAGGRRLEACKLLGWDEISCTYVESLSEKELRVLELEENIRRKDLTEYELSRNMVELAEIKAEELRNGFCTESVQKVNHRPPKPDNIRNVAKEIGVSPMTLSDAKAHVEAVGKYPELIEFPKYKAIETAKTLDTMPDISPEAKKEYIEEVRKIDEEGRIQKQFEKVLYPIMKLPTDDFSLEAWLSDMDREMLEDEMMFLEEAISKLNFLKTYLSKRLSTLHLIKKGG